MKMLQKVVLAGGSGYLGGVLAAHFAQQGWDVVILSRKAKPEAAGVRTIFWDGCSQGQWVDELEGSALVVNLSGKNVNCRYTAENKKAILDSRIEPTQALGKAIAGLQRPPGMWINLASATIYRHAEDRPQDERTGEIGQGFSESICIAWEDAFWACARPGVRQAVLRVSLVLGPKDGVFPRLKRLADWGLGGQQGNGKQWVAWIHETDFACALQWIYEENKQGIYNITAPQLVQNETFMKMVRLACKKRIGLPAPAWLLEIGAVVIGTETELILKSRWVLPARLLEDGFKFRYPEPEAALRQIALSC